MKFEILAAASSLFAMSEMEEVTLGWEENPEPTVVGYRVYRMTSVGYAIVGETDAGTTEISVTAVTGDVFAVKAFSGFMESGYSDQLQVIRVDLQESSDLVRWEHERSLWLGVSPVAREKFWRLSWERTRRF